jgi:hypothetical protein
MDWFGFWVLCSSASDPRIATFVLLAARAPALGLVLYQV